MLLARMLLTILSSFMRLGITPITTNPNLLQNLEQNGALIPNGAIIPALQALATNGSPAFGNWSFTTIANNLTANTMLGGQMVSGIIRRFSPNATYTDSTDTATNIIGAIPGAVVNQTFPMIIANLGSGLMTVGAGTGVTLQGSTNVSGFTARLYIGTVTGSTAVTLSNMFSWPLGPAAQGNGF